ncbi:MAG: 50S ribosomal protein L28 [Candidatus Marinimicrobia bacterium]|nr:50S ribosomal protein L28 [Candidatus Neomarinimicrobiota bacterium]
MAKVCEVCGKRPTVGYRVSHAHNRTKHRWLPNLQSIRVLVKGAAKKLKICTSCIRTGKFTKAA